MSSGSLFPPRWQSSHSGSRRLYGMRRLWRQLPGGGGEREPRCRLSLACGQPVAEQDRDQIQGLLLIDSNNRLIQPLMLCCSLWYLVKALPDCSAGSSLAPCLIERNGDTILIVSPLFTRPLWLRKFLARLDFVAKFLVSRWKLYLTTSIYPNPSCCVARCGTWSKHYQAAPPAPRSRLA